MSSCGEFNICPLRPVTAMTMLKVRSSNRKKEKLHPAPNVAMRPRRPKISACPVSLTLHFSSCCFLFPLYIWTRMFPLSLGGNGFVLVFLSKSKFQKWNSKYENGNMIEKSSLFPIKNSHFFLFLASFHFDSASTHKWLWLLIHFFFNNRYKMYLLYVFLGSCLPTPNSTLHSGSVTLM